ncbi:uncharacterized protein LOC121879222 [Homarus americanus]|uniref:uncharacterized protein LOC121879222 n=1 Tax=Homarus americanus TaxID=6706 RepID=UPI001C46D49E|nr:uncharacterized protein LOC121879222 [Homarus americanus]
MRRLWVWMWLACLVTINKVYSEGTKGELNIYKIIPKTQTTGTTICFKDTSVTPPDIKKENITVKCWTGSNETEDTVTALTGDKPNYCIDVTRPISKAIKLGDLVHCVLTITNGTLTILSGEAEFPMPADDAFPTCTKAYYWKDNAVVGVACSKIGSFDKAYFDLDVSPHSIEKSSKAWYTLKDTVTSGTSNVSMCKGVKNNAPDAYNTTLDVCIPAIPIYDAPESELTIKESELEYDTGTDTDKATLSITINDSEKADDLVLIKDGVIQVLNPSVENKAKLSIDITSRPTDKIYQYDYLVVDYSDDDDAVASVTGSLKDYQLIVSALTSNTVEMRWTQGVPESYKIHRDSPASDTSFTDATVSCTKTPCTGYFVDLTKSTSYTCSVSNDSSLNKITDQVTTPGSSTSTTLSGLFIKQLYLKWNSDTNTAGTTVCFTRNNASSTEDLRNYELIMISNLGQVLKSRGATRKADSLLCFEEVTLETRVFDVTGKVEVIVVKRDSGGQAVLSSGQSGVFFISPKVEGVNARTARVSWYNPGGHTLAVRRKNDPAPITTSHQTTFVHYFSRTSEDKLVVDTEDSKVKITAEVPLNPSTDKGM